MPPTDSSALIVARFLKSNNFTASYEAFIREAGLSDDAGLVSKGDLTLETLLEEKRTFDLSSQFEKLGPTQQGVEGWTIPAPSVCTEVFSTPTHSNILSTIVQEIRTSDSKSVPTLIASSADRRLSLTNMPSCDLRSSIAGLEDSPILSCAVLDKSIILSGSMSGKLVASDTKGTVIERRSDHAKYIVKIATLQDPSVLIATAGWDNKVFIYRPTNDSVFRFNDPIATISLQSKPESIILIRHPTNSEPVIILSRSDSNHLFYYSVEPEPRCLGKQNLAPHSNAWVAFTPVSLAICPTDSSLLAVGTSSVPHMKLLIVRTLIPPYNPTTPPTLPPTRIRSSILDDGPATETQASVAREALQIMDREEAAIQLHCTAMAPQNAYSTPAVAWRPNGSGVWVNGDDGTIRGIETTSGKVVCTLQGHEEGTKVRCLWAGNVAGLGDEDEELLVSGGFDQKLFVWRVENSMR